MIFGLVRKVLLRHVKNHGKLLICRVAVPAEPIVNRQQDAARKRSHRDETIAAEHELQAR